MQYFVEGPVRIFIEEPRKIKKVKMNKECNKCKIDKDISEFYKRSGRGTGIAGYTHNVNHVPERQIESIIKIMVILIKKNIIKNIEKKIKKSWITI